MTNLILDLVIAVFVLCGVFVCYSDRNTCLGVQVSRDGKQILPGKHGYRTTIGRDFSCDVHISDNTVSRLQAVVNYNPNSESAISLDERGKNAGVFNNAYKLANHVYTFRAVPEQRCFEYGFLPTLISCLFITLQAITALKTYDDRLIIAPYAVLLFYVLSSYFLLRADKTPLIESTAAMLLTFFIESTIYKVDKSDPAAFRNEIISATIGVCLYVICAVAMHFFLYFLDDKARAQNMFRFMAAGAIIALIALNLVLGKSYNGALNWIKVGPLTFQPSEPIKILLIFAMILPIGERLYTLKNLILDLGLPVLCMLYALVIRDAGVLVQYGVIFACAILIQNSNILTAILMILGGATGMKLVMKYYSTAATRINAWLGESANILDGLKGDGVFKYANSTGYQSTRGLAAAFKNGGLFGTDGFDLLKKIEASDSDIVTLTLAQKHGCIILYMMIFLLCLFLLAAYMNLRQQGKTQQTFTSIATTLIIVASVCNILGSCGIIPFTGVVLPFVSAGNSAAISYGLAVGGISSSAISKNYMKAIKGEERRH